MAQNQLSRLTTRTSKLRSWDLITKWIWHHQSVSPTILFMILIRSNKQFMMRVPFPWLSPSSKATMEQFSHMVRRDVVKHIQCLESQKTNSWEVSFQTVSRISSGLLTSNRREWHFWCVVVILKFTTKKSMICLLSKSQIHKSKN